MPITGKKDSNPHAVNILKLQRYNFNFFSLEEVVFFEYLIVKARSFKFKQFYHSTSTISGEIGIKRTKLESIIKKFGEMGILHVELKGYPQVKHFTVNFERVAFFLPQIYQSAENGKLSAEISKLLADFYNPLVETYQKKNNIESINKKNKEEEILEGDTGWVAFGSYFFEKIREWEQEFNLTPSALKYEEIQLYQTYKMYGDDTILYLREYLEKNKWRSKISDFLKPDKYNPSKNAFIEAQRVQERKDGKNLLQSLVKCFNDRRTFLSNNKKGYSQTSLLVNDALVDKAVEVLRVLPEHAINNAFIAYADAIIKDDLSVRKILPYFFTYQYGTYSVIEQYLDHFNVNYSYTPRN